MDLAMLAGIQILYAIASLFLISVGLAIIFGMMGVINFAHGEFLMLGGFAFILSVRAGVNFWVAMFVVAPLVVAFIGVVIERLIIRFPEAARKAEQLCAPHVIAQYLTQLAGEWNSFYAGHRIVGGEHEGHKLKVARAFANTMERGLALLGIPAPESM